MTPQYNSTNFTELAMYLPEDEEDELPEGPRSPWRTEALVALVEDVKGKQDPLWADGDAGTTASDLVFAALGDEATGDDDSLEA
jgi:hypothetical protein